MKTKLVAVIALIFCAFMAEASKVEGNGNIITKEISVDNYSEIELGGNIEYSGNNFWGNRSNKKFPVFKLYAWTKRFLENYDRRESIPTPLDQIQ